MQLTTGQQATLKSIIQFLSSSTEEYMVIKGKPGTGKSTLVEHAVPHIKNYMAAKTIVTGKPATDIIYCASTNQAASSLAEIINEDVRTIHNVLGLTVRQNYQTGQTFLSRKKDAEVVEDSIIVFDEAFSTCRDLWKYVEKCTLRCKIIFVGDPKQCAPIGQLKSPIEDLVCRTEELTEVKRNSGALTDLANHWRDIVDTLQFAKFDVNLPEIQYVNGADFAHEIKKAYAKSVIAPMENKILCWTNDKSIEYSDYVRQLHNLPTEFVVGEALKINNSMPKLGYHVDQTVEINSFLEDGTIHEVPGRYAEIKGKNNPIFIPNSPKEYKAVLNHHAKNKNWPVFFNMSESIADVRSIHSCTVHKSQGSTYENVFIDLNDIGRCNIASDVARMMNVACSRMSKRVVFRGALPDKYGG